MHRRSEIDASTAAAFMMVSLVFGSSFLLTKVLVAELTPLQVVAARTALGAGVVMSIVLARRSMPSVTRELAAGALILALLDGVIPHTLIAFGQTRIDSGMTSVLVSTMPLFTAVIAWLLVPEERFTFAKALGLVIGLFGVSILVGGNGSQFAQSSFGHVLVLLGALSYAGAAVYARGMLARHNVMTLTGIKLAVAAVISVALTLGVDGSPHTASLSGAGIAALLGLGVVSTGIVRVMYFWVIGRAGSVRASLITYVIPVVGVILGWAALGEPVYGSTLAGMALIIGGVAAVMYGQQALAAIANVRVRRRGAEAQRI